MDIYSILLQKSTNDFYLKRYIKFIEAATKTIQTSYTEDHHICPKALFPEYVNLREHSWNKAVLSFRQHYIAHLLLAKAINCFQTSNAVTRMMSSRNDHQANKIKNSRLYAIAKERASIHQSEWLKENHPFRGKKHTAESKQKMTAAHLPRMKIWIYFLDLKKKINLLEVDSYLAQGWLTYFTDEDRKARKQIQIEKTKYWHSENKGYFKSINQRTPSELHKQKMREQSYKNSQNKDIQKRRVAKLEKKIWITNGVENQFDEPENLNSFLESGWVRGRTRIKKKKNLFFYNDGHICKMYELDQQPEGWNKGLLRKKTT